MGFLDHVTSMNIVVDLTLISPISINFREHFHHQNEVHTERSCA